MQLQLLDVAPYRGSPVRKVESPFPGLVFIDVQVLDPGWSPKPAFVWLVGVWDELPSLEVVVESLEGKLRRFQIVVEDTYPPAGPSPRVAHHRRGQPIFDLAPWRALDDYMFQLTRKTTLVRGPNGEITAYIPGQGPPYAHSVIIGSGVELLFTEEMELGGISVGPLVPAEWETIDRTLL